MPNSNMSTFHISTLPVVLKQWFKKLLCKPKEIKQQALLLCRQQMAPKKMSKRNQVFHFYIFFFKQDDKTPRNHETTRAESELLAPGTQLVYFNQFQMQSPALQMHMQSQSTQGIADTCSQTKSGPGPGSGPIYPSHPPDNAPAPPTYGALPGCFPQPPLSPPAWKGAQGAAHPHAWDQTILSRSQHGTLS